MDLGNLPARFAPTDNPLRFRQGSIVSVEADQCTLTVTIAGSTVPISGVRYATGVMPVPGLAIWLATDGRDLWAISTLMTTDTTPWGYYVDYTFARGVTPPPPATLTGNIPASPPWYGSPPSGTTPLWMSEATKNPQGVVVGSWSLPVQLTGDPGPAGSPGTPAPLLQIRYSLDGASWHSTYTGTDAYISTSSDGGVTWSAAVRIVGPAGADGAPLYVQYSHDNGVTFHDPPWDTSDNFMRQKVGTGAWSGPILFVGTPGANGTNGNYIAVAYKEGARTGIAAPTGNGPIPSGWSGTPVALAVPVTNCLWVSRATCSYTNVLIGSWSTPTAFIITADYVKAGIAMSSPSITGGTLQTDPPGTNGRTALEDCIVSGWSPDPGLWFFANASYGFSYPAGIYCPNLAIDSSGTTWIISPSGATANRATLELRPGMSADGGHPQYIMRRYAASDAVLTVEGTILATGGITAAGISVSSRIGGDVVLYNNATGKSSGTFALSESVFNFRELWIRTTDATWLTAPIPLIGAGGAQNTLISGYSVYDNGTNHITVAVTFTASTDGLTLTIVQSGAVTHLASGAHASRAVRNILQLTGTR
jgi:hypothetical protein